MELFENRRDVSSLFCSGKNPCSYIHDMLERMISGNRRLFPLSRHEESNAWISFVGKKVPKSANVDTSYRTELAEFVGLIIDFRCVDWEWQRNCWVG